MSGRPAHLDLHSEGNGRPQWGGYLSPTALSPRLNHADGDIPPALSPLDAFAEQGRLLAKQLEESRQNGRRMSRLPPLNAEAFVRPGFYRSKSAIEGGAAEEDVSPLERSGTVREMEHIPFRPKSYYPRLSGAPLAEEEAEDDEDDWMHRRDSAATVLSEMGILGPLRTQSPEPLPDVPEEQPMRSMTSSPQPAKSLESVHSREMARTESLGGRGPSPRHQTSVDSNRSAQVSRSASASSQTQALKSQRSMDSIRRRGAVRQSSSGSRGPSPRPKRSLSSTRQQTLAHKGSSDSLAPPRSYGPTSAPRSPNMRPVVNGVRSVPVESDVEEDFGMSASFGSIKRQPSSSSCLSAPHSPQSFHSPIPRSPSISSEHSVGAAPSRTLRPAMNFSRPRSNAGRPSFDVSSRQASSESQRSFFVDDSAVTPQSITDEGYFDPNEQRPSAAPAMTYAKYSLPRGRTLEKDATVIQKKATHHFHWEESDSSAQLVSQRPAENRPPSPESPPRPTTLAEERPATPEAQLQEEPKQTPSPRSVASFSGRPSSPSVDSNSTIRPAPSRRSMGTSMELTAEDHLAKGIACHQKGSLNESTYHLRIAARKNHPTAMLLYALACRHGWGMRPNQREGVQWLRKAVDSAGLEVADDETTANNAKPSDLLERKAHRAQLALGIYELGVSHMNGWGIEQDKALALRCFEIAGNWGDTDALAEAGFCYVQGVGCKKDLKKAAKFYRLAESKGMSMVGNSWIYKDKYKDDADERQGRSTKKDINNDKKGRDKSRTRTIFGRKRSVNRS